MLGRHGNNLFWMARYLERSENMARRIQAVLHHSLSREDEGRDEWAEIIVNSELAHLFDEKYDGFSMINAINFLLRERQNLNSVITLITKSRQNGRAVRTSLTQEVWMSLNETWISSEALLRRPVNIHDLPIVLEEIIKGSSLFRGALYGTMLHNDIFNFLRLGTYVERADNTLRTVYSKYHRLLPTANVIGVSESQSQWEVMLRSLSAWRSLNWLKKGRIDPVSVADFLIFDQRMPRSINFCYYEVVSNLTDLARLYKKEYKSLDLARTLCCQLKKDRAKNIHKIDLKYFITEHIIKNNELGSIIADDFNLV